MSKYLDIIAAIEAKIEEETKESHGYTDSSQDEETETSSNENYSNLNVQCPTNSLSTKLWTTKIRRIPPEMLVWAPCLFFKGGNYCYARICKNIEAMSQKYFSFDSKIVATKLPIPTGNIVVEFFSLPLSKPKIISVAESSVRKFNAIFGSTDNALDDKLEWNEGYKRNMLHVLCKKYSSHVAHHIFEKATEVASEYLRFFLSIHSSVISIS